MSNWRKIDFTQNMENKYFAHVCVDEKGNYGANVYDENKQKIAFIGPIKSLKELSQKIKTWKQEEKERI